MQMQQSASFLNYRPSQQAAAALLAAIRMYNAMVMGLDSKVELHREAFLLSNNNHAKNLTEFSVWNAKIATLTQLDREQDIMPVFVKLIGTMKWGSLSQLINHDLNFEKYDNKQIEALE